MGGADAGLPLKIISVYPRCATSWGRLARLFEAAIDMFGSAPLEAQLLALLVMRHPGLFGIVGAEASCKEGCRDSRDGRYTGQSYRNLSVGPAPATTTISQDSPVYVRNRFAMPMRASVCSAA